MPLLTHDQFKRWLAKISKKNLELGDYIKRTVNPKFYSHTFICVKRCHSTIFHSVQNSYSIVVGV